MVITVTVCIRIGCVFSHDYHQWEISWILNLFLLSCILPHAVSRPDYHNWGSGVHNLTLCSLLQLLQSMGANTKFALWIKQMIFIYYCHNCWSLCCSLVTCCTTQLNKKCKGVSMFIFEFHITLCFSLYNFTYMWGLVELRSFLYLEFKWFLLSS